MTGPSSSPRGERPGTVPATWQTTVARTEHVVDDNAPDPAPPNRKTRRALARAAQKKKQPGPP
jgi:hypothetical protein